MAPEPTTQPVKKDWIDLIGLKFMELTHSETPQEARLWLGFIAVSFLLICAIIVCFQNEEKAKFYQARFEQVTICHYLNARAAGYIYAPPNYKAEQDRLMKQYCNENYTKTLEENFKLIKVV